MSETKGIWLVIVVITIQIIFTIIAVVIECDKMLELNLPSYKNFKMQVARIANSNGSVGKLIPNPKPISLIVIERGVKKTAIQTNLSSENIARKATKKINGISETQYTSNAIAKAFTAINTKLIV
ncbi:MAG: hypothetical protein A3K10_08165 [Bacteroidetes bacterium RIFCSPLOWO2_12_FULL_31_6]|nr:MAG: hypothetical protein A3K10_08165 [Bacteroidetes bacterium RIFCSPLOWO2_12_FULL_31_6]